MSRTKWLLAVIALAAWVGVPRLAAAQASKTANAEQLTHAPVVEGVGSTTAVIAWTTNRGGSSIVHYGTSPSSLSETAESPYTRSSGSQHATHRVHLKNLKPSTTYYFQVDSGQGQGTGTEVKSEVGTFTTKASGGATAPGEANENAAERQPVKITDGPRVEKVDKTDATIAWTTNAASSSVVRYGTSPASLSQTAQSPYADAEGASKQTHRVEVKNLKPNTTYYFMVDSGQGEGTGTEAKSQVAQFKTKQ